MSRNPQNIINRYDNWILGGKNFDEDLHFSSFYIRTSSEKYVKNFGYKTIVAFYNNFNEEYYIPKKECERISKLLIERMKNNPKWMRDIIDAIYKRSDDLRNLWENYKNFDFSTARLDELLEIYQKHNQRHWNLYKVARIPEALDRGVQFFTNYLMNYINKLSNNKNETGKIFALLTTPTKPSVFQEELFELLDIVALIKNRKDQATLFQSDISVGRLLMLIDHDIFTTIINHTNKWKFIGYHGYGERKLLDLKYYLLRIKQILKGSINFRNKEEFEDYINNIKIEQDKIISNLGIDKVHKELFYIYSEIGLAKLYRRYIQLLNFYYLDKLLFQIAMKMNIKEGIIKNLLPEEIIQLVNNKLEITNEFISRLNFSVYIIDGGDEFIISGEDAKGLYRYFIKKLDTRIDESNKLKGIIASPGYAKGTCKIIIRPEDSIRKSFREGDILVSESTDPDLIDLIKISNGVLTQQGGVTSHAAIICRELGKPAIMGIKDLLSRINDGDEVIIDANIGVVTIIEKPIFKYLLAPNLELNKKEIGNKAYNLCQLKFSLELDIPDFFVVRTSDLLSFINNENELEEFNRELRQAVDSFSGDLVVIRSSFTIENGLRESKAGFFPSILDVRKSNIVEKFTEYVRNLQEKYGYLPMGSIIIQEMVDSEYSGVCFTMDPISTSKDIIVIEIVKGPNEPLTSGKRSPDVYLRINKQSGDILEEGGKKNFGFNWQEIIKIIEICKSIEDYFKYPQDIEWVYKNGKIYILQTRPITIRNISLSGGKENEDI